MPTKLFISQPMCDKTKEEILAVRQQAKLQVEMLLGYEVEVVDNFGKFTKSRTTLFVTIAPAGAWPHFRSPCRSLASLP